MQILRNLSLARIVLLLAALALAGCSTFRPPPPPPPEPSDEALSEARASSSPRILFDDLTSDQKLAIFSFMDRLCRDSLNWDRSKKAQIFKPCGNLTTIKLFEILNGKLPDWNLQGQMDISNNTFTISQRLVPITLPIFSPVQVRFPERFLPVCSEKQVICEMPESSEKFGYISGRWEVSKVAGDPYLGVTYPKYVLSRISPTIKNHVVPKYPPESVQVELDDGFGHIDLCWCRSPHLYEKR